MRPLIVLLIFFSRLVLAESPSARVTTSILSESGSTGISTARVASATMNRLSVDASTGSLYSFSTFRLGFDRINPDYSRYLITEKNGKITELSKSYFGTEFVARSGVDLFFKKLSFSLDGSTTTGRTPFPGSMAKVSSSFEEYLTGSKYSIEISRSDYLIPESYYIDPDNFQSKRMPTRNLVNRLVVSWEQIMSERTKAKVEIFGVSRPKNRPPFGGAEASLGWANTIYSSIIGKLGIAHEQRSSPLFDNAGYFDGTWAQIEYRLEPSYNWSLSGILGTILERESPRGIVLNQKIGTDSVEFLARTRGKSWEIGIKGLGSFSNTGYQSFQFGGDFTWQI